MGISCNNAQQMVSTVRVLCWVNPILLRRLNIEALVGYWKVVACNLRSIAELRYTTWMAGRACALTLGHLLGAMHLKMVVAHDGEAPLAFVGGIDFAKPRVAGEMHSGDEPWHDIAVKIEGPAIQALYNLYKNLWNTQFIRYTQRIHRPERFLLSGRVIPAVQVGTRPIPERVLSTSARSRAAARTLQALHRLRGWHR